MPHPGFWVYILASKRNGTLYIGVTSNLSRREWQHQAGQGSKFAAKYKTFILVYAEHHQYWEAAYMRESQLKKWPRHKKLELIETSNPGWQPLHANL